MKTYRKSFALAGALSAALLLSATGAMAAPQGYGNPQHAITQQHKASNGARFDKSRIQYASYNRNAYRDRDHRPPQRVEFAGAAPHAGMAFHRGHWHWAGNQWVWIAGTWLMVLQAGH